MLLRKRVKHALLTVALLSSGLSAVALTAAVPAVATPPAQQATKPATKPFAAPAAVPAAVPGKDDREVTLITGDRLIVSEDGSVIVAPNATRQGIRFSTYTNDGQKYVIPSDALPALTAGELDYQLFSVTELLNSGFTSGQLPLMVTYANGGEPNTRTILSTGGATVTRTLSRVSTLAATANEARLGSLWTGLTTAVTEGRRLTSSVRKVWLDRVRQTSLDQSVPQVGAPIAWAAGYDGTGVTVAVLDSGIDTNHPDLSGGKVVAAHNFSDEADTNDLFGHGTHVASTIAGTGAASQGRYRGVAPGAKLLNGKVCNNSGQCSSSAIIDGMEWAVAQGASVVNLSLGGTDSPGVDPLEQEVNDLTASTGTLFVIAAGNIPQTPALASPGTADAALTVGAVDKSDNLASFSQRGPRAEDAALKPDLTAPGVDITAARAGTSGYITESGTSMATPHVAGAAAIMKQRRPGWSATQIKSALIGTAVPNASLGAYEQGSGRLDIGHGYQQSVLAQPASISLGRQTFPHGDDPILTNTVTYNNQGSSAVTLNLALTTRGPSGGAAPAGMFALSASSVTVPAGGSASVTLTTNTRVTTPDGYYTGAVVATGSGVSVRTPFAVDRSIETYDLTIDHISRQGVSTAAYFCLVQSADGKNAWLIGGPGPVTVPRLPRGSYLVTSEVFDFGPDGAQTSVLTAPRTEMTQNRSLVMDARLAQPVSITVPDSQVAVNTTEVGIQMTGSGENAWFNARIGSGTTYTAQIGSQYVWGSVGKVGAILAQPGPNNDFYNSSKVYHLAWYTDQRLPTGWSRNVAATDLGTVQATYAGHIPGSYATRAAWSHPGGSLFGTYVTGAFGAGLDFSLPFQRTEFYNTDGDVRWHGVMAERVNSTGIASNQLVSPVTHYTGNTTTQETWNRPVYGPAFTSSIYPQNWVVRRGDTIIVDVPLTGDGDGHAGLPHPDTVSGNLVLKRNGTVVGQSPYPVFTATPAFPVPAGNAQYRLEADLTRSAPITLSNRISAAWTFNSDSVDPNSYLRLPLWAVTFSPGTDLQGTAPSGRSFQIPLRAQVQPDAASSGLRTLTVDYSLDDGATWRSAAVTTAADGTGTATVTHPSGTGFVSLRTHADDWAGNAVDETMIRAYRIA